MEIEGGEIEKNIVIIVRNVGFVMHLFIITYPTQLCFFLLQEFPLDIHCGPAIEVPESSDSADDICWHLIKEKKYIFNPQKDISSVVFFPLHTDRYVEILIACL